VGSAPLEVQGQEWAPLEGVAVLAPSEDVLGSAPSEGGMTLAPSEGRSAGQVDCGVWCMVSAIVVSAEGVPLDRAV
jgi:hypothetical protein